MRKILTCVLATAVTLSAAGQLQPAPGTGQGSAQADSLFIRKLATEILENGKAYDNLRHLTKKIGGRLAGSPGMVKAEKWGLELMKTTGADTAWLQECLVPHWVRGGKDQLVTVGSNGKGRSLDVVALGNSQGTGAVGLKASVVEVVSFDDLQAKKDQVKGKIVFFNYKFKSSYIHTFEGYSDAVKYRGGGPSAAAKLGAAGVIVRSISNSTDNIPHTGSTSYDSAYAKLPAVAIGLQDADWLSTAIARAPVNVAMKTFGHFLPDTIGHNVIGELVGSEFPDQVITVGGHLDSWDNCEGAHDDGAGCVQTIEMLRTFRALGYKPKHTIRFVLFANEENGTRGGKKYAEVAKARNEKHIFALESDEGGFTPRGFGLTVTDAQYDKLYSWKALLEPYGGGEIMKGGGGADIGPLNRMFNTPLAGLQPDSQRYFDYHHARTDVFENVNKRELLMGAVSMTALVYLIDQHGL